MLKRLFPLCALAVLALPGPAHAILLGNHQITIDLVGTTQYFEIADFIERDFPEVLYYNGEPIGLDWGFRQTDLYDPENWDLENLPPGPMQNRNVITMELKGNLDIGARLRTALSPRFGIEGYIKYTPADLLVTYNGADVPAATFTRYSGATNPMADEEHLVWVTGDYPTYHIVRFGANLDYTFLRARNNELNAYVSAGFGAISYFREGKLLVPTDYDEEDDSLNAPTAPVDISYYLPNDTYWSANVGTGFIIFLHRMFGLNFNITGSYTPFEMDRAGFDKQDHFLVSASIGYTARFTF